MRSGIALLATTLLYLCGADGASVAYAGSNNNLRINEGGSASMEWRMSIHPEEYLHIFFCGYTSGSNGSTIVPLAFDVFGDQFDSVAERTPPKRYHLPTSDKTLRDNTNAFYDTQKRVHKLVVKGIKRNVAIKCEVRYTKGRHGSERSVKDGLVLVQVKATKKKKTVLQTETKLGWILLGVMIFVLLYLPSMGFVGRLMRKKFNGQKPREPSLHLYDVPYHDEDESKKSTKKKKNTYENKESVKKSKNNENSVKKKKMTSPQYENLHPPSQPSRSPSGGKIRKPGDTRKKVKYHPYNNLKKHSKKEPAYENIPSSKNEDQKKRKAPKVPPT